MNEKFGIFKLSTGEEIVSEYDDLTTDKITLKSPRVIILGRDQAGRVGTQLGPWILTEQDSDFSVDRNHIIAMKLDNLDARLVQAYLKNTTGIDVQTAAANLIKP